jgi:hypothetical protein
MGLRVSLGENLNSLHIQEDDVFHSLIEVLN